jgi:hypothetical protein
MFKLKTAFLKTKVLGKPLLCDLRKLFQKLKFWNSPIWRFFNEKNWVYSSGIYFAASAGILF